jgi:hypothetical protein
MIPPLATVASQMVFTDGSSFVITLNVTDAQSATFNTATCTDSSGQNPVNWPLKTGTAPFTITYGGLTLLRLILVAYTPGDFGYTGTGLLTITLQTPTVTVAPITVIPDPTDPCA